MSYDGIVTRAVVDELNGYLVGGRIDKIYQPEKDELLFHIYNKGKNFKLLMSASSNYPRLYITEKTIANPDTPPTFCMLLRKMLTSGYILSITQRGNDRTVVFEVSGKDELGETTQRELIVEIMGKHSNIILIDKDSKRIFDSIKRVPIGISRVRQILPGLNYEFLPLGDKLSPLEIDKNGFYKLLNDEAKNTSIKKFFYKNMIGVSPLIASEICQLANIDQDRTIASLNLSDTDRLFLRLNDLMRFALANDYTPAIYMNENSTEIIGFHVLPLELYGKDNIVVKNTVSEMLDSVYVERDTSDRVRQKSSSLKKTVQLKLERAQNKLGKLKDELEESHKRDKYKIYADLIQSNLQAINKGQSKIELLNFYDPEMSLITVPLDIKLGAAENAQHYYKKYAKLKNASVLIESQLSSTEEEISYLEHVLISLDNSTEVFELDEIRLELINEGYINKTRERSKMKKLKLSLPLHFISTDGFNIYVGRNNRQNEELTMKFAKKDDIWLHTKGIPGSHVIIRTEKTETPMSTIEQAALIAAWYSKGKNSPKVEVDYTLRKNVRKPSGSRPGFVTYEQQKTLNVNLSNELINNIRKVED
ncbi:MAG: NFACT RNA binding domain-containing protein [Gudongella sp.]|jgi:predicted ribosome quality control (RQC) complex YloA/Tae2 family protein|nr:NFACT RNA binding domain-containing protein [Gudongella sp.]